jgi:hypothetical protein
VPVSCPSFYPALLCGVKISKGLKQAYELQDFTFQAALALKESLAKDGKLVIAREDASAICSSASAGMSRLSAALFPRPGWLRPGYGTRVLEI